MMDTLSGIERASTKIGGISISKSDQVDVQNVPPQGNIPIGESSSIELDVTEPMSEDSEVDEPVDQKESMSEISRLLQEGRALAGARPPPRLRLDSNKTIALDLQMLVLV